MIYVLLGVLYESYIHPLTILSGLPSAAIGALGTLMLFGQELTIIASIGILMLIGIVKKNAIMMIDFALEAQRKQGMTPEQAIHAACLLRFRPIMMTTLAALMGALPIALGLGAGAELRQPLGLAVVGGLIFSQVITLYITPVLYLYFDALAQRHAAWRKDGARCALTRRPAPESGAGLSVFKQQLSPGASASAPPRRRAAPIRAGQLAQRAARLVVALYLAPHRLGGADPVLSTLLPKA